ncbi:hypothetical protein EDD37DRAFT_617691 [Exophiala viscosa]|uniref:Uncharacterized protein n=1 Tax=Exophiala viscosa TaxID=2486360 RepID=A0AAN6E1X9_9EURO|nr:hypothetical protein EDD36DRAFT_143957 [Exophiala viscosa]KAI1629719.1 hypothetical protein EDD37DRAFT_617691 [Exophiala viscosa]
MTASHSNGLYEGEALTTASDAPAIMYFKRGNPSKPLAIFIPGAAHLARVSYGGHTGYDPKDFIAHWLPEHGYNFLAISYPLETEPSLMPTTRPEFTVREWGAQAVEITRQIIDRENLTNNVILLVWSMGGKIIQPYVLAARELSIDVNFVVPIVATPAIRGVREKPPLTPSEAGYATGLGLTDRYFLIQLQEQRAINGGKPIIPEEVYLREYMGNFPIGVGCYGVKWSHQEQAFVVDANTGYEVADEMALAELPFVCSISCDSPADLRHSVADKYTWGFMLTFKLFGGIKPSVRAALHRNAEEGREVIRLIHSAPEILSATVEGGHDCFIGERGAKRTAELVVEFEKRLVNFKQEFAAALG